MGPSVATVKPMRSFAQMFNMNFGFLGIQFGWALQLANMSVIYEYLGARPDQIPILWLAAPLTGLLIQPLIGAASDRTWTRPRPPPALLPGRRAAFLAHAAAHAERAFHLGCRRVPVGAGRLHQRLHGALPRLCH